MPDYTAEQLESIYSEIIEQYDMPASVEVKETMSAFNKAFDEYIAAVTKDAFCWGYKIAMKERN